MVFSNLGSVPTKNDEWIEIKLPLVKFEATSFGSVVRDAGAVKPEEVDALGFKLSDKKAGAFTMVIECVRVERAGK